MSKYTEAKARANRKWDEANRANYWRATIVFPAEEKAQVMAQAERAGKSLSDYVRDLIKADRASEPTE